MAIYSPNSALGAQKKLAWLDWAAFAAGDATYAPLVSLNVGNTLHTLSMRLIAGDLPSETVHTSRS